jgi:hypothetical protein
VGVIASRVSSSRERSSMVSSNKTSSSGVIASRVSSSRERASMVSANKMSSSGGDCQ